MNDNNEHKVTQTRSKDMPWNPPSHLHLKCSSDPVNIFYNGEDLPTPLHYHYYLVQSFQCAYETTEIASLLVIIFVSEPSSVIVIAQAVFQYTNLVASFWKLTNTLPFSLWIDFSYSSW